MSEDVIKDFCKNSKPWQSIRINGEIFRADSNLYSIKKQKDEIKNLKGMNYILADMSIKGSNEPDAFKDMLEEKYSVDIRIDYVTGDYHIRKKLK